MPERVGGPVDLGELVVSLRLRTEALEKGLDATQKKLQDAERQAKKKAASMRELESSYKSVAMTATTTFAVIAAAVATGLKAYNQYTSTMKGFENQIKSTGQSMIEARKALDNLSSDGLISESDTAASIKNLVNYGFTVEKASDTVAHLKDTAVDNRQAHYNLGEAVRVTTEGIRMENSVLSDAAGVQKNIAKMKEEYAKSLGKTVDSLTQAEKAEAIYQGVLVESAANVGRAAEYSEELGGRQAELAAQTMKLSQAFGEAQAPAMQSLLGMFNPVVDGLTGWAQKNTETVGTITAMGAALTGLTAAVAVARAGFIALTTTTKLFGTTLMSIALNPVILGLTVLAGGLAVVMTAKAKTTEEAKKLAAAEEEYNRVVREGIQLSELAAKKDEVKTLKELQAQYERAKTALEDYNSLLGGRGGQSAESAKTIAKLHKEIAEAEQGFKKLGISVDEAGQRIITYEKAIKQAEIGTSDQVQEQAKLIAQTSSQIMTMENLIRQYKTAEKGSSEWQSAQNELAKEFPQLATAMGINIGAIENLVAARRLDMQSSWDNVKAKAAEMKAFKEAELAQAEAFAALIGMDNWARDIYAQKMERVKQLKAEIEALNGLISTKTPAEVTGIAPVTPPKSTSAPAYENKALDAAYRQLEHKKRLDQLTLEQEEATLQEISAKYIKKAEERMTLEERLYDVRTQIAQKAKDKEADLLEQATAQYQAAFEDKVVREELSAEQQFEVQKQMYTNIIQANEQYLKKVLADEKYTAEEKAEIQSQVTETLRQNINDRLRLEKDYYEQIRQAEINSVNNLSQGIQSALREKYQAEREAGEQVLKTRLDQNETWRKSTIESIKEVYDIRVKSAEEAAEKEIAYLNETISARITAINEELAAMEKAETAKTRTELDAEDDLKIERLRARIAYEHDEFNKAQLQKELNKVLADQEKRHQEEQLTDKRDALKTEAQTLKDQLSEQTSLIKDQLVEKKELLAADRDAEIERINFLADKQREALNTQLAAFQAHYNQLLSAKRIQAEAEKMIIQNQQTEIIALLQEFGSAYELTGQTLGQKMYEGFKEKFMQIQSLIDSVNRQIDAARNAAMAAMASASAASAMTSTSVTNNNRSVSVTNLFSAPVTSPSDVSRATQRMSQQLL